MFDGAVEIGLEPTFERFNTVHQNFAGLGLDVRYYLAHFRRGRFVPWINASIAPGGTDLRMGNSVSETRLSGPVMNLIQAGVGISYFVTERSAVYAGLNATQARTISPLILRSALCWGCRGISRAGNNDQTCMAPKLAR